MTSHAGTYTACEQQRERDSQEIVGEEAHRSKEAETKKGEELAWSIGWRGQEVQEAS
jgi:hypothetical protein